MLTFISLLIQTLYFLSSNGQVIFSGRARTWADAQADCESRGSDLLTAQGNPADIQECADATNAKVWVGLNKVNQNGWQWVAGDVSYDRNSVEWSGRGPANNARAGDCAVLATNGAQEGKITNKNTQCTDTKRYCCNPIGTTSTTTTTTAPYVTPSPTTYTNDTECPRIRKEWNTLDQSERDLYINGVLALANNGKFQTFTRQHGQAAAEAQAHGTSGFLPWHRLFLWELETQIRNLGGDYECFGLPYWNMGKEVEDYGFIHSDYSILNSGLGGIGDSSDNYCVTDGAFTQYAYTPEYCPGGSWDSNSGNCCLRRRTLADSNFQGWLYTNAEMADAITQDSFYGRDDTTANKGIRKNLELGPHGAAHCTVGGCGGTGGHLGNGLYSPSDPIFYLLHGYVDMLWALWQDYNDYDLVDKDDITGKMYDGRLSNSGVDTALVFDVLINTGWSTLDGTDTARDMHSIVDMGYKYDRGSFITEGHFDETNLNDDWFEPQSDDERRRLSDNNQNCLDQIMYNRLVEQYGDELEGDDYDTRRQIFESLATMACRYKNVGDYECRRPKNFDDFSDIPLGPNPYNNHDDLDVSLEELVEAVKDYPCMVETRYMMWGWVSRLGGIWRLARGDFDRFCDKQFLRKEREDDASLRVEQCIDRGYVRPESTNNDNKMMNHAQIINNMDGESTISSTSYYFGIVGLIMILCFGGLYFRSKRKGKELALLNETAINKYEYSSI